MSCFVLEKQGCENNFDSGKWNLRKGLVLGGVCFF